MTVYKHWIDFVSFGLDPERVRTCEQRLDVQKAFDVRRGYQEHDAEYIKQNGALVTQELVVKAGDQFEAMEIDDYGQVTIWTAKFVCRLRRDRGIETLVFLPRHPPEK